MRECGECTLCCLLTYVPELNKSINRLCKYCKEGRGCVKYETRPQSCKDFKCAWLTENNLPKNLCPLKSHAMIEKLGNIYVILMERNYMPDKSIQQFAEAQIGEGKSVLLSIRGGQEKFIKVPQGVDKKEVLKEFKEIYERM